MKKLEYLNVNSCFSLIDLDEYGQQGWELIYVSEPDSEYDRHFVFKREVVES